MGTMKDDYRADGEDGRIGEVKLDIKSETHATISVLRLVNSLARYTTIATLHHPIHVYPVKGANDFYTFDAPGLDHVGNQTKEYTYTFKFKYIYNDAGEPFKTKDGRWSRSLNNVRFLTDKDKGTWGGGT